MEREMFTLSPCNPVTGHLNGSKLHQETLDWAYFTKRVVVPCNRLPREVTDQVFSLSTYITNYNSNRRCSLY